jgi:ABC-type branched-subunit amino acid transport system ATPase component
MRVLENRELGAYQRNDRYRDRTGHGDRVFGLFPRLKERTIQEAINTGSITMSGGKQQMLAIGRA